MGNKKNSREIEITKHVELFFASDLCVEFNKELDIFTKNALDLIKDSTNVDDLYTAKGILIAVEKMKNIFNTIDTKARSRLS